MGFAHCTSFGETKQPTRRVPRLPGIGASAPDRSRKHIVAPPTSGACGERPLPICRHSATKSKPRDDSHGLRSGAPRRALRAQWLRNRRAAVLLVDAAEQTNPKETNNSDLGARCVTLAVRCADKHNGSCELCATLRAGGEVGMKRYVSFAAQRVADERSRRVHCTSVGHSAAVCLGLALRGWGLGCCDRSLACRQLMTRRGRRLAPAAHFGRRASRTRRQWSARRQLGYSELPARGSRDRLRSTAAWPAA